MKSGRSQYTEFFPKEKMEGDKMAKSYALKEVEQLPPGSARDLQDETYTKAYKSAYEYHFNPVTLFYKSCRNYYSVAVSELISRFECKDEVFQISLLLKPSNARNLKPKSLRGLFKRFPILNTKCDFVKADSEWRSHASLRLDYFGVSKVDDLYKMSVDDYWKKVLSALSPTQTLQFPNLTVCIQLLMCLPSSNAAAERVFSQMKLVKTSQRNRQHTKTTAAILKTKFWLRNQNKRAADFVFPDQLVEHAKRVKSNATICGDEDLEN